jgi:hypothetical protein
MRDIADPQYQEYAVLKGRQIGMSWAMGALVGWYCQMHDSKHALLASFNLEQAQIILNYTKTFNSRLKKKGWHEVFIEGSSARNIGGQMLLLQLHLDVPFQMHTTCVDRLQIYLS